MSARRILAPLAVFAVGNLTGLCVALLLQPGVPTDMTDLGRHVVSELDTHHDWLPTGSNADGMYRPGGHHVTPSGPPAALSVVPTGRWTVRVLLDGLNVSEHLSRDDHRAILEALARRRAAYAVGHAKKAP